VNNSTMRLLAATAAAITVASVCWAASTQQPLRLTKSIPLPMLHDGDFDHFTVDLQSNRLFSAAEENSKVLVFNLKTGQLIHTLTDVKAPHSLFYRDDLHRLFVVDGDLGVVRMYDGVTYKPVGNIELRKGADSATYDPATKYLYVINGGHDGDLPNCWLSVVDTTSDKRIAETKLNSNDVEAVRLESRGPRMFVNIRGNNAVEVFDRKTLKLLATWPMPSDAAKPTAMALDEGAHRLFVGTRAPGRLVVLDSDTGKVLDDEQAASMVDDMAFDPDHKRIYFAGTDSLDVFQQGGNYQLIDQVPTGFRAKTAIFVPQLNRYYLGVPHHNGQTAELRIYSVVP
jgi:DNA-binding beta-propeller fold protein YncE